MLIQMVQFDNIIKMGNEPNNPAKQSQQKMTETEVLKQAGKISEQLQLYQSENQLRQHRHLIARILIYGHSHLLTRLKNFSRERQKQMILYLKDIDYETTDLLYQNLVLKRIQDDRKKIVYQQYNNFRKKNTEFNENLQKYKLQQSFGQEALQNKKVAILLFAGGFSSRFKKDNKPVSKQVYTQSPDQKCLLEIAIQKINEKIKQYDNIPVYLVHNQVNSKQIAQILTKYPKIKVIKMMQNKNPIVNLSGKICLRDSDSFQILSAPRGCGDLANLSIKGQKLFANLKLQGIQYVCAMGVQNICADIIDPYFIGVLAADLLASSAFKCTYPDNQNQNLKRVVVNKSRKCLESSQLQILLEKADKKCYSVIRRSPVWMNYVVFRPSHIQQYLQKNKQLLSVSEIFIPKKIQCTYWNPITNSQNKMQHCYMFQRQICDLLLNPELRSIGVMVERQLEFIPVVSVNQEKTWSDAYSQYMHLKKNFKKPLYRPKSFLDQKSQF